MCLALFVIAFEFVDLPGIFSFVKGNYSNFPALYGTLSGVFTPDRSGHALFLALRPAPDSAGPMV